MTTLQNVVQSLMTVVKRDGSEEKRPASNVYGTKEATELVSALHREASEYIERSVNGMSLVAQWTQNGHRFLGNHYHTMQGANALVEGYRVIMFSNDAQTNTITGLRRATLNRIQTGVISNVAGQTQQEIVIRWNAQETGDPPRYWMTRQGARKLQKFVMGLQQQAMSAPMGGTPEEVQMQQQATMQAQQMLSSPLMTLTIEQLGDPAQGIEATLPLNDDQADAIQELIAAGQLTDEDVVVINDKLRADVAQEVFDCLWKAAHGDQKVVMNEYLCNIFGHCPMRFQWDDQKHRFQLENTHILNVWIDPKCESIDEAEYVIFDHLLSADKAISIYPAWEAEIRKAGETGPLSEKDGRRSAPWKATDFQRAMVVMRTTWIRHQRVPMTPEDALEAGLIQPAMTQPEAMVHADGNPPSVDMDAPVDVPGDESEPARVGVPGEAVMEDHDEATETVAMEAMEGHQNTSGYVTPEPQPVIGDDGNPVYILVETGAVTSPDNDNWPKRIGIREIVTLPANDTLLADRECAYSEIPVAWNVNIPIPYSPYGQGEPQRLEDLQIQVNRLFSIMMNHAGYYQAPQRYWKASTLEAIKRHGFQIHSRPGAEVPIPDQEYNQLAAQGKMCITQDIPILPPIYMALFDKMLAELDRMIGNVDVRQGMAPAGVTSGKAIDSLRMEAAGPLAFKAKFTEYMVERVALLAMKSIVNWMPLDEWQNILNRYSQYVLADIISGIDPDKMNVVAEVTTGRGTSREQEEQRGMLLYQNQLISRKTMMQRARINDVENEERQIDEEFQRRAMLDQSRSQMQPQEPQA